MRFEVHITPNASRNEITGYSGDGKLKIKIQSPPLEGAANRELVRFLAKKLKVSRSRVRIIRGERARNKLVEIDGNPEEIKRFLEGES